MPDWLLMLPTVAWCLWVFVVGLVVGSFLNVVVARLPDQMSVLWPNSRCFTCRRPIRFLDNVPLLGYLRLRGRCRDCGAEFSSRYLWVELGTGLAFLALFVVEVLGRANDAPAVFDFWRRDGLRFDFSLGGGVSAGPPAVAWAYFAFHAALLALLIAAALVDLGHQIIPPQITYVGTLVGLLGATLMPWPAPGHAVPPALLPAAAGDASSRLPPEVVWMGSNTRIPTGATLWPVVGPPPAWAPPGSWQLGLLNGLAGAAAGMAVGRAVKFLFEVGMRKEALGLGDADLLMMTGAFLGWQPAVMALPMGALVTLPVVLPLKAWDWYRGKEDGSELPFGPDRGGAATAAPPPRGKEGGSELPFGPGIAAGVVVTWLGWPWLGELARVLFDPVILGFVTVLMAGGFLVAGLMLRRKSA